MRSGCRLDAIWMRSGCGLDAVWIGTGCGLDAVWMRSGWGLDEVWMRSWCGLDAVWVRAPNGANITWVSICSWNCCYKDTIAPTTLSTRCASTFCSLLCCNSCPSFPSSTDPRRPNSASQSQSICWWGTWWKFQRRWRSRNWWWRRWWWDALGSACRPSHTSLTTPTRQQSSWPTFPEPGLPSKCKSIPPSSSTSWHSTASASALLWQTGLLAALLAPHQLGVAVRNGCEAVTHAVQAAVEEDPTHWVLQADLVNAFNSPSLK